MKMYTTLISAYGTPLGIDFRFDGTVANTLQAHRLVQHYQQVKGEEVATKILDCKHHADSCATALLIVHPALYSQYFEQAQHPSSPETLLKAAKAAGLDEAEAKAFIEDESEGLQDVKMLIGDQARNGIDAVPYVVIEGKRRDFTLEGAKETSEYAKVLEQVAKESG